MHAMVYSPQEHVVLRIGSFVADLKLMCQCKVHTQHEQARFEITPSTTPESRQANTK